MKRLQATILFLLFSFSSFAQTANAGVNDTIPRSQGVYRLLGSGTGTGSLTYSWRMITTGLSAWMGNMIQPDNDTCDVMMMVYTDNGTGISYYDFELSVTDATPATAKDTVRIYVEWDTPLPPQRVSWRVADAADAASIPNCNIGDFIIDGANSGWSIGGSEVDIFVGGSTISNLGAGKKILIKAGIYNKIEFFIDSGDVVGTAALPVYITTYGGQVETAKGITLSNFIWTTLTGRYVAGDSLGSVYYKGHDSSYNFSSGQYGFYVNNRWQSLGTFGVEIRGDEECKGVGVEYVEVGNGGYAGFMIKENDVEGTFDSCFVRSCYVHDIHAEAGYIGSTQPDPEHQLSYFSMSNMRWIRAGNEGFQFSNQGEGNYIYNNVIIGADANWRSPFAGSQDFGMGWNFRNGGHTYRNNMMLGAGEQFINMNGSLHAGYPFNGDSIFFENNAFIGNKGYGFVYQNVSAAMGVVVVFDSTVIGQCTFEANEIFSDSRGTNTNRIFEANTATKFVITNTMRDGSKTTLITGFTTPDTSGTTVWGSLPSPRFANSGFPESTRWESVTEQWTDSVYRTWHDEFVSNPGVRIGDPVIFNTGDTAWFMSKCYVSLQDNNTRHLPQGVTDAWWGLVTWTMPDATLTTIPPDDFRLLPGDYYRERNIGLLDVSTPTIKNYIITNKVLRNAN